MPESLALVFGESSNDTAALRHFIPALLEPAKAPRCRPVRDPGTLSRGAAIKKRTAVARAIAIVAKHESKTKTVAVVAHEDCDEIENAHVSRAEAIERELRNAGVETVVAAAPAWEIESWWMLFPEALAATRKCWTIVNFSNRNVGTIADAKEVLRRALRSKSSNCPDYAESDSERIAQEIARLQLGRDEKRIARSASLKAFRDRLEEVYDPGQHQAREPK